MIATLASIWRWLTTSKHERFLEQERIRLLKEVYDLHNALLSASGLPMLPSREASKPLPSMRPRILPSQYKSQLERFTAKKHEGDAS